MLLVALPSANREPYTAAQYVMIMCYLPFLSPFPCSLLKARPAAIVSLRQSFHDVLYLLSLLFHGTHYLIVYWLAKCWGDIYTCILLIFAKALSFVPLLVTPPNPNLPFGFSLLVWSAIFLSAGVVSAGPSLLRGHHGTGNTGVHGAAGAPRIPCRFRAP